MKTTAVGIHAPSKRQVGAVVPAKNLLCIVFEELHPCPCGRLKPFALYQFKSIGWIRDEFHLVMVPRAPTVVNRAPS